MKIDRAHSLHVAWAGGLTMDQAEHGLTIIEDNSLA